MQSDKKQRSTELTTCLFAVLPSPRPSLIDTYMLTFRRFFLKMPIRRVADVIATMPKETKSSPGLQGTSLTPLWLFHPP